MRPKALKMFIKGIAINHMLCTTDEQYPLARMVRRDRTLITLQNSMAQHII